MALFKIIKDDSNRLRAISTSRVDSLIQEGINDFNPLVNIAQPQPDLAQPSVFSTPPGLVQIDRQDLLNDEDNFTPTTLVNVVDGFNWKLSPNAFNAEFNRLIEHPYIYLKEYRVNKSTLFTQLLGNLQTILEGLAGQAAILASQIPVLPIGTLSDLIAEQITGQDDPAQQLIGEIRNNVQEQFDDLIGRFTDDTNTKNTPYLRPYGFMYSLEKTDFDYKLPFFNTTTINKKMSWQSNFSDSKMSTGAAGVGDFVETSQEFIASHGTGIPKINRLFENNQYIERGKYFNPAGRSEPIIFNFPLLNTQGNLIDIKKNFDFIWLLCFQNCAIRSGIADIDSPCIYEVTVPGWRYMLFAIIEDIRIEYLGTRRRVSIEHPASETLVDVIIPEVYRVNLTIRSLISDSANLLLKAADHGL